ncbi:Folate-binding protein 1 [Cardamine amara subsp. amara]|uniref:Folate-binding protein 1 n=1 Tax=Cardamine amara subsp. amara TaxID=228776 RepID=A0ABD1AYD1_CARAN
MGRYLTTTVFLVLTPILLLHLLISSSSGASFNSNESRVCISKGGRFQPYESEGKPPKSAYREFKDLNLCRVFSGKTCCSASQMQYASLAVKNLANYGEATKDCLGLFELLECSICYSNVGIRQGPPRICASFCDRVFEACSDAYFSSDAIKQVKLPCGANKDTICEKASKWVSNGTAFCNATGFTVQTADDSAEEPCYGSKASFEPFIELEYLVQMLLSLQLFSVGLVLLVSWETWRERQARIQRNPVARRLRRNMIRRRVFQI